MTEIPDFPTGAIDLLDRLAAITVRTRGSCPDPATLGQIRGIERRLRKHYGFSSAKVARKAALRAKYGDRCYYCECWLEFDTRFYAHPPNIPLPGRDGVTAPMWRATEDHVVPRSQDGPSSVANLVPSCGPCNEEKGNGRD